MGPDEDVVDAEAEPTAACEPAEAAGRNVTEIAAADEGPAVEAVLQAGACFVGHAEAIAVSDGVVNDEWIAVAAAAGAADAASGDEAVLSEDAVSAAGVKAALADEEAASGGGQSAAAAGIEWLVGCVSR